MNGFEIDADYYKAASERLEKEKQQVRLELPAQEKPQQISFYEVA
jgi:hypothetical protein